MPNNEVLSRAGIPSMYTLLRQRRLRWLGHTHRMADGRIPKDLLYGELATGTRSRGRPKLRFKDVCKRKIKACNINTEKWEASADDRTTWKQLRSYLHNRSQSVSVNGETSCPFDVKHGVPQGSCLGPLLFILYVSKLFTIANAIYQKCTHMLTTRNCTLPSNRLMLSQLCKHALLIHGSGC